MRTNKSVTGEGFRQSPQVFKASKADVMDCSA